MNPFISICCYTYNQKDYIKGALDSILAQKLNYDFEILVYDDASKDGTVEILQWYEQKFPNLVKVIYQSENQFGLGSQIYSSLWSHCRGKYIALCDGDDYWIDPNKLNLQISALEKSPKVGICFHDCISVKGNTKKYLSYTKSEFLTQSDVIKGGGELMPTSSILFRSEYVNSLPNWFFEAPVGDYFLQIICSKNGAIRLPAAMSIYRLHSTGSWSASMRTTSSENFNRHFNKLDYCLSLLLANLDSERKGDIDFARASTALAKARASLWRFDFLSAMFAVWSAFKISPYGTIVKIYKKFFLI